jgi:hypothetical protein
LERSLYRECPACGSLNDADRVYCRRCLTHLTNPSEQDLTQWQAMRDQAAARAVEQPKLQDATSPVEPLPAAEATATPTHGKEREPDQPLAVATSLPQVVEEALAELRHLLPMEASVALPHRAVMAPLLPPDETARADAARAAAALFQRVATEPAATAEPLAGRAAAPRQAHRGERRIWLYLAVLLAALLPVLTRRWSAVTGQPQGEGGQIAAEIATLGPQDAVLVVFDYAPSYAGELDPLANALLRALAQRAVRTVALSTQPAGVGLAQRAYQALAPLAPDYTYGDDYVILGLLPGQEAGLHALTQGLDSAFQADYVAQRPLREWPALYGLPRVDVFHHVVVLSDDEASVRRWVEQVQTRSGVPLDAWVTARIEPLLIPYERAGQIRTVLTGASGAAELLSVGQDSASGGRVVGLTIYWGVLCLTAIVGNAAAWRDGRQRRQAESHRTEE